MTKAKILIADDEKFIRQCLATHLNDIGYITKEAKDGAECLELINKFKPDAILLDLNMPKIDGIEVLRKIREKDINIPVLVISAMSEIGAYVETRELSLGEFISKPFKLNEVGLILQAALAEAKDYTVNTKELKNSSQL